MAKPTARVLLLLETLQSGGTHRVADLAGRLGVDERTVRRYVTHLLELDVPVEAVRGRHGGYRLAPGFRLPPLMLTDHEAVSAVLGLELLRRSGLGDDGAARSAEEKIRRSLPRTMASRLAALQESLHLTGSAPPAPPADAGTLLLVAEAARDGHLVGFAYRSASGRDSARVIAPYGVVGHGGRWLVSGVDQDTGGVRTFRLDRMVLPRRLERTFATPEDLNLPGLVVGGIAAAPRRHRAVVRARTDLGRAREILPASVAVVSEAGPGWVEVVVQAESLTWVPALLARLGCELVVVEPKELRDEVATLGRLLVEAARGPAQTESRRTSSGTKTTRRGAP